MRERMKEEDKEGDEGTHLFVHKPFQFISEFDICCYNIMQSHQQLIIFHHLQFDSQTRSPEGQKKKGN